MRIYLTEYTVIKQALEDYEEMYTEAEAGQGGSAAFRDQQALGDIV